jgi:hypothetical protein
LDIEGEEKTENQVAGCGVEETEIQVVNCGVEMWTTEGRIISKKMGERKGVLR